MPPSLQHTLPELADELSRLLQAAGHECLARQVPALKILDRCRCGDEFCATFYTQPQPLGAYGAGHENIKLEPERGMLILDVVRGSIACVEVLYRDEIRRALLAAVP
jgi:hypothetical protein